MDLIILLIELVALFIVGWSIVYIWKLVCEMRRPEYLKPASFFYMENDSDLLEITAERGLQVTVRYAEYIYRK